MRDAVPVNKQHGRVAYVESPIDRVFALDQAGKGEEAREFMTVAPDWTCSATWTSSNSHEARSPWRGRRDALLTQTAQRHCPAKGAGGR